MFACDYVSNIRIYAVLEAIYVTINLIIPNSNYMRLVLILFYCDTSQTVTL